MQETVGSVSDTRIWAGPQPTDLTIGTLTFTAPTMAPPTRIILAFGGFRRPIVPASGGVCGLANENKLILQLIRSLGQKFRHDQCVCGRKALGLKLGVFCWPAFE